jgi:hypothetical protein
MHRNGGRKVWGALIRQTTTVANRVQSNTNYENKIGDCMLTSGSPKSRIAAILIKGFDQVSATHHN